ncbi:MAG: dual specificity protein phosphatase family protein [Bdellovibrionales bacterium]
MRFKLLFLLTFVGSSFAIADSNQNLGILGPNFHSVEEGRFYRSAQLNPREFRKYIARHGIKTVINLRGVSEKKWWVEESEVLSELDVVHINIKMSARRLPHREDLIKLLESYESAQYPILIHCEGGADRTGEASAIYQMLYMNKTKEEALKMLRFKYFHIPARMPAKRYFIKDLWQGVDWVYESYHPCESNWKYYDKEEFCI